MKYYKLLKNLEEEFKLPEKWCVQDSEQVSKWANETIMGCNPSTRYHRKLCIDQRLFPKYECFYFYDSEDVKNYTEITTEQFVKYVLGKENIKKIIGYKLKEDCKQFTGIIASIIKEQNIFPLPSGKITLNYHDQEYSIKLLKKAGVLDLWFEEVYEEKTLQFGGYDVTFEKVTSGVRITCNGETGTLSQVEAIYNYFKPNSTYFKFGSQEVKKITYGQNGSWNLKNESDNPTEIKIGCTTGTWKEFIAIYEKAKSML